MLIYFYSLLIFYTALQSLWATPGAEGGELVGVFKREPAFGAVGVSPSQSRCEGLPLSQVPATAWPHRTIGLIKAFVGGGIIYGTGFLIGPRVVLTAAHNLVSYGKLQGEAKRVFFIPWGMVPQGAQAGQTQMGWEARDWKVTELWRNSFGKNKRGDFGVLFLENPVSEELGWMGLIAVHSFANDQPKRWLQAQQVHLYGYPSETNKTKDQNLRDQRGQVGSVSHFEFKEEGCADCIGYTMNTSDGQSGSPIWVYDAHEAPFVVGIHILGVGQDPCNKGLYLSQEVLNRVSQWLEDEENAWQSAQAEKNPDALPQAPMPREPVGELEQGDWCLWQSQSVLAQQHYSQAKQQGDARAWARLGECFQRKECILEALESYRKGTFLNDPEACIALASLYDLGQGVSVIPLEAKEAKKLVKEYADRAAEILKKSQENNQNPMLNFEAYCLNRTYSKAALLYSRQADRQWNDLMRDLEDFQKGRTGYKEHLISLGSQGVLSYLMYQAQKKTSLNFLSGMIPVFTVSVLRFVWHSLPLIQNWKPLQEAQGALPDQEKKAEEYYQKAKTGYEKIFSSKKTHLAGVEEESISFQTQRALLGLLDYGRFLKHKKERQQFCDSLKKRAGMNLGRVVLQTLCVGMGLYVFGGSSSEVLLDHRLFRSVFFMTVSEGFTDFVEWGGSAFSKSKTLNWEKCSAHREEVKKVYREAAVEGSAEAQFELGVFYEQEQNSEEAMKWFQYAHQRGHLEAQYRLGLLYAQSSKNIINQQYGKHLIERAAKRGHKAAKALQKRFRNS